MPQLLSLSVAANMCCVAVALYAVIRLGGVRRAVTRVFRQRKEDTHWLARQSLFRSLTPPGKSIVIVGDSLTELADWSELLNRPVLNRGISGDTTSGIMRRLATVIACCPRSIFLMTGSNDLFALGLGSETIKNNVSAILNTIRAESPSTTVYLQSILPVSLQQAKGINIRAVNESLATLADGNSVIFIDLFSHFEKDGYLKPELSFDGVHLNGNGYMVWRDAIAPFV